MRLWPPASFRARQIGDSGPPVHIKRQPDSWILTEISDQLSRQLGYSVGSSADHSAPLNYFVNYHRFEEVPSLSAAFFTHRESWYERYDRMWWEVMEAVDLAVFMSEKYELEARQKFPKLRSVRIPPGYDPQVFRPKAMRIGVVGRSYGNGRKGEDLLEEVVQRFPNVEWIVSGGNWNVKSRKVAARKLPDLFRTLDYLLIPSRTEGGPMSAIEALACGVPVISADVGWMPELPHIEFESGDLESLCSVISGLLESRERLQNSVEGRTWSSFAEKHKAAFTSLIEGAK